MAEDYAGGTGGAYIREAGRRAAASMHSTVCSVIASSASVLSKVPKTLPPPSLERGAGVPGGRDDTARGAAWAEGESTADGAGMMLLTPASGTEATSGMRPSPRGGARPAEACRDTARAGPGTTVAGAIMVGGAASAGTSAGTASALPALIGGTAAASAGVLTTGATRETIAGAGGWGSTDSGADAGLAGDSTAVVRLVG